MIDLKQEYISEIKNIIKKYLPYARIKIFGSRVNGKANENSDVDIAIIAEKKLDFATMAKIKMDFEESNIPYRVDIVDYASISENFKKIIDSSSIEI